MSDPQSRHASRPGIDAAASAAAWLREVDGRLMRKREDPDGPDGWVAIVRTPATTAHKARVIVGFGDSAAGAVSTARDAWQRVWREISTIH